MSEKQPIARNQDRSNDPNNETHLANDVEILMTSKEKQDYELAKQMRQDDRIKISGRLFELFDKTEIDNLINRGVFVFESLDKKHESIRIFKSRLVREIKDKEINNSYEKSRLVIQEYNDDEKAMILTQSPIIQRVSQGLIIALALFLMIFKFEMNLGLRNITQTYTQFNIELNRVVLAHLPKEIEDNYLLETIMKVIKPLYELAEADTHGGTTYNQHHRDKLEMRTFIFDSCLLIIDIIIIDIAEDDLIKIENNIIEKRHFELIEMQTDDSIILTLRNGSGSNPDRNRTVGVGLGFGSVLGDLETEPARNRID